MSRRGVWPLLMVLGLFAVSCGSGEVAEISTIAVATTRVPAETTVPTTGGEPASDGQEVEAYLVEMSNLAADLDIQVAEFEQAHFEATSPPFVEPGEEQPPQTLPPEDELFEDQHNYWLGYFDLHLEHADVLDAVDAPNGFESAHQDYVNSFRNYFSYVREQVAGFGDLDELFEFFNAIFDPLAELPAGHEERWLAVVDSCRSLVDLGSDAGFRTDLGCPSPPEEPIAIDVQIGDEWSATPNPLPVGDGLVLMTITNTGSDVIRPVVVQIFGGDPFDLPVVDGVVDLSRDGEFDPSSGFASFGIGYAGLDQVFVDEFGVTGEPPELLPGESVEAVIWSEETMVVFDYRPGEFEAGAHVVIERSEAP